MAKRATDDIPDTDWGDIAGGEERGGSWAPPDHLLNPSDDDEPAAEAADDEPEETEAETEARERDASGRFVAHTARQLADAQARQPAKAPKPEAPPAAAPREEVPAPVEDPRLAQYEMERRQFQQFLQSPLFQQFQQWQQGAQQAPPAKEPEPEVEQIPDDPVERIDWLTRALLSERQRVAALEGQTREVGERERRRVEAEAVREVNSGMAALKARFPDLEPADLSAIATQFASPAEKRDLVQVGEAYALQMQGFAKRWAAKQGLTRSAPAPAVRGAREQPRGEEQEDTAAFVKRMAKEHRNDWTGGAVAIMRRTSGR